VIGRKRSGLRSVWRWSQSRHQGIQSVPEREGRKEGSLRTSWAGIVVTWVSEVSDRLSGMTSAMGVGMRSGDGAAKRKDFRMIIFLWS
jgi:hypothetical protein